MATPHHGVATVPEYDHAFKQEVDVIRKSNWTLKPERAELPAHVDPVEHEFQQIKSVIHRQLIESLDLSRIGEEDKQRLYEQIRRLARKVCQSCKELLGTLDRERLLDELMAEIYGVGPLQSLMRDTEVTDILVNDPYTVYVERNGRLELTDVVFADEDHLLRIIRRIVSRLGRRIDESSPMVDARLPDGSRINAIIPPLSLDGPSLSIRLFGARPLELDDLLAKQAMTPEMALFLQAAVEARIGFLVSGGTGAGKTTFLNALSASIPEDERIVTIEDSAELKLQHRHLVRLETRPANSEGTGELNQRDLVRNSLRMRPDRIIVGEVRGAEVWDMLQAMNSGHEGSLTTIHANSARDALARLEMMVAMTGHELPVPVVRQYIASGMRLIVHLARLKGGSRRVVGISEICGVEEGRYHLEEVFGFEQTRVDEEGNARGNFFATGYIPACLPRLRASGCGLADELFESRRKEVM